MPYVPYRRHRRVAAARKPAARKPAARRSTAAVKADKPSASSSVVATVRRAEARVAPAVVAGPLHQMDSFRSGRKDWRRHSYGRASDPTVFTVAGAPAGFPLRKFVKFVYEDVDIITVAAFAINAVTYRLNGVFDPYSSGIGHQPRYYDTYLGANNSAAPYANYRVHGCKFKFEISNFTATGDQALAFANWRTGTTNSLDTPVDIGEQPNLITGTAGSGNSQPALTLEKYVKIAPMLGIDELSDDDNSAALYNALPANQVLVDIGLYPLITTGDASYNVRVNLTYYVELFTLNLDLES